jgi:hypothetical protein
MKKIPVGRTIASAYNFTFGHVGAVIGLIWLPLVIYTLGRFFVLDYYAVNLAASSDPSIAGRALLLAIGFWFVSILFTAIIGVSLTRQAMAPRSGSILAHFAIGPAEFNYFLSLLAVFLVMIAVYIAAFLADLVLGAVAGAIENVVAAGNKLVLYGTIFTLVGLDFAFLFYVGVRLAFLVAPVTVAEGKIDLIRAWQLTKGNFWRVALVVAVTVGPIFVVSQLAAAAIVGPQYIVAVASLLLSMLKSVVSGGAIPADAVQSLPDIASKTPLLLGLEFLLAPFSYGLMFAAPAFAYRALVGGTPTLPEPDSGPLRPA